MFYVDMEPTKINLMEQIVTTPLDITWFGGVVVRRGVGSRNCPTVFVEYKKLLVT